MKRSVPLRSMLSAFCGAAILLLCLISAGCSLPSAGSNDNAVLVGTWLRNDGEERDIFVSDDTYTIETYSGGIWSPFMGGQFSYSQSTGKLTLDGNLILDVIMNTAEDRMCMGVDALSGGDKSTLLGTWVGSAQFPSGVTHTRTWTFTATTISYHSVSPGLFDQSATGSVTINTGSGTFVVSSSTDVVYLPNGTYDYIVVGDGITIENDPGDGVSYFDK